MSYALRLKELEKHLAEHYEVLEFWKDCGDVDRIKYYRQTIKRLETEIADCKRLSKDSDFGGQN